MGTSAGVLGYSHAGDVLLNHAGTVHRIKLRPFEHFRLLQPWDS